MTALLDAIARAWCALRRHPLAEDVCLMGCRRRRVAERRRHYREALRALRSVQ